MTLQLTNVTKAFRRRTLFAPINANIEGQWSLLGPNGSGKSTLLRICAGLLRPSSGAVQMESFRWVGQEAPVYPELTPAEHGELLGCVEAVLLKAGLQRVLHQPARVLSRGQRQRLHLALAFSSDAKVLLLDEPYTGLDAEGEAWLNQKLDQWPGTVLMAVHEPRHVRGTQLKLEAP